MVKTGRTPQKAMQNARAFSEKPPPGPTMNTRHALRLFPSALALALLFAASTASAFYDPGTQRWLNRDPIEELDGINLYQPLKNSPASQYDPTGLFADGNNGQCPKGKPKGHSDFYGHNCFDFPAEDHGSTSPYPIIGTPANHFQDLGQSLRQARAAMAACDAHAFARAMHRVQDCFSHSAYSWEPPYCWGHAADGTTPDKSNVAWDRANRMTRRLVDEYIQKCGLPNDHIPIEGTE